MSNLLDSIVANEEVLMTVELIRAFKIVGCEPACHCCGEDLLQGDIFKLEMIKTEDLIGSESSFNDEMLCKNCTANMLISLRRQECKDYTYTGYTRKHIPNISE